jgi:hypothetical protein
VRAIAIVAQKGGVGKTTDDFKARTTYVGNRFDPRDGLMYHVNNNATVRASYGSAYVAPSYSLINPSPYVVPGMRNVAAGPVLHAPRTGFHAAVDLLRAYAHGQNPNVGVDSIFSATPAANVQLPSYPYRKIRNDLFYTFGGGAQARLRSTSYGGNNAFGQSGTNIFNHNDDQAGGIHDGGCTFPVLGGGALERSVGPGGLAQPSRAPL